MQSEAIAKSRTMTTVCARDCYDTCGLRARVSAGGRLEKVEGDCDHPVTAGLTCPRAAADHRRLYRNRIRRPARGHKVGAQDLDWSQALEILARRLAKVLDTDGSQAVLLLDYAGNCGLLAGNFHRRLWNLLGVSRTDHALCNRSGKLGICLHYGRSYGVRPEQLPACSLVVFWGFNAAVSAPHIWIQALKGRRQSGAKIVVVDPLETRMAQAADLWIRPRPGSDVSLALAVMSLLWQEGRVDMDFVNNRCLGFEELAKVLAGLSLEQACEDCGLDSRDVRRLAGLYGRMRPSATMIGIGMQKNDRGADQARAVSLIPALLGLERGFFYSNSDGWDLDLGPLAWKQDLPPARVVSQVDLARVLRQGKIKLVFVSGTNPAATHPAAGDIYRALAGDDIFTVVHDTHWSLTARCADLVLPALTYLEKEDLVLPWSHPFVRLNRPVVAPVTAGWSEVDLMRRLNSALGLNDPWVAEDPWPVVASLVEPALADGSWQDLESGRLLKLRPLESGRYQTPSGKLEFAPARAAELGCRPVVRPQPRKDDSSFCWLSSAVPRYTHSQFTEVYGPIPDQIFINPEDGARLGIRDGNQVVLSNARGRFIGRAVLSAKVPPSVIWSARPLQDNQGRFQNQLVSGRPQRLGGGSRYNSTRVQLAPYQTSG